MLQKNKHSKDQMEVLIDLNNDLSTYRHIKIQKYQHCSLDIYQREHQEIKPANEMDILNDIWPPIQELKGNICIKHA